ncbi:MAG: TIR domain-containing protein [Burkholderiales bacterium]
MRGLFVSYRRADAAGWAGRLVADLAKHLPDAHVFHDIASIRAGEDFPQAIERALASCAAVLVVIGPNWLGARNQQGELRLGEVDDPVRVEIRIALSRADLLVVPVLVGGAALPSRNDLPDDLAALSTRNAAEVSDARWDFDVDRLIRQLRQRPGVIPQPWLGKRFSLSLVIVLVAAVLVWYAIRFSKDEPVRPAAFEASPVVADPEPPTAPAGPQPSVVDSPKEKLEPAHKTTVAKGPIPPPARSKVHLDGVWEADYANSAGGRMRMSFEFETRGSDVFGSLWAQGREKYPVLDGRLEQDRLKFCHRVETQFRKGDGWEYGTYRECYDGIVARNEIRFIATYYIDHPTQSPERLTFTARRAPK